MNKDLLTEFQSELAQIKEYISHIEQIKTLVQETNSIPLLNEFKEHYKSVARHLKIFEYKAIIISLYGLLEKYVGLWVHEYLNCISAHAAYNDLSSKIRDAHFEFSTKLLSLIAENKHEKYKSIKEVDVVKNLYNCITNLQSYKLNVQAFTLQSGNLTHKRLEEIFKNIDIIISKELTKNGQLTALIGSDPTTIEQTKSKELFNTINDLVERRNIIAHGSSVNDLLDLSNIQSLINFLEQYCNAIFHVFENKFLEFLANKKYQEAPCSKVFPKKKVIVLKITNQTIKINDPIIIKTVDGHFHQRSIFSLRDNNKIDQLQIAVSIEEEIAITITGPFDNFTEQCTFYTLK